MALLLTEGFGWTTSGTDLGTYGPWGGTGNGCTVEVSGGLLGAGPLGDNYMTEYQATPASSPYLGIPLAVTTFFCGGRCNGAGNGVQFAFANALGSVQFTVAVTATGSVQVSYTNGAANSVGFASVPGTGWYYLEIGGVMNASTGSVTIRINGNTVLTATGLNNVYTGGGGAANVQQFYLMSGSAGNRAGFAHVYVCDATTGANNTFLGDVRVQTLLPSGNNAVAFTHNGLSANYLNAALVPPNPTTDYNASVTVGNQDVFNVAPMSNGLGTIFAVTAKAILAKTDAGARTMSTVVLSNATTSLGTNTAISISPRQYSSILATDPATSTTWTTAGVNAAKVGYKLVS